MLLGRHTDDQYTDFISRQAQKGWWLSKIEGNIFTFKKKPYDGKRVCCYTVLSPHIAQGAEDELYDELDKLRAEGWDLIALSPLSSLMDKSRHAFLYEKRPGASVPASKAQKVMKARYFSKAAASLAMSIVYLGFVIAAFLTGNMKPVLSALLALLSVFSGSQAIAALASSRHYLGLERSVLSSFAILALLAMSLLFSLWA